MFHSERPNAMLPACMQYTVLISIFPLMERFALMAYSNFDFPETGLSGSGTMMPLKSYILSTVFTSPVLKAAANVACASSGLLGRFILLYFFCDEKLMTTKLSCTEKKK